MKAEFKDAVLRQLIDAGINITWNISRREAAKEIGITDEDYYNILVELEEAGLVAELTARRSCDECSACVTHNAVNFINDGGYVGLEEAKRLNKEHLLLQIKALQAQCEQLEAEGKKFKEGDQTAIERILAAGANLATIASSIVQPIIKLA